MQDLSITQEYYICAVNEKGRISDFSTERWCALWPPAFWICSWRTASLWIRRTSLSPGLFRRAGLPEAPV